MRSLQMIFWPQQPYQHFRVGSFLKAFEDLALKEEPLAACVVHLHIDALSYLTESLPRGPALAPQVGEV